MRDHPRSCGKDWTVLPAQVDDRGSPPLVRERHEYGPCNRKPPGITPARAGKTVPYTGFLHSSRDHPRSCGKDHAGRRCIYGNRGSPPLVRERPHNMELAEEASRITPARAGKTYLLLGRSSAGRDHPRSCGKDTLKPSTVLSLSGSPPLVRERQ